MKKSDVIPRLKGQGEMWDFLVDFWETGGLFFDAGRFGERWIMWDIALIQAILQPEFATSRVVGAPRVRGVREIEHFLNNSRRVTVYTDINVEGMLDDFWRAVEAAMRRAAPSSPR